MTENAPEQAPALNGKNQTKQELFDEYFQKLFQESFANTFHKVTFELESQNAFLRTAHNDSKRKLKLLEGLAKLVEKPKAVDPVKGKNDGEKNNKPTGNDVKKVDKITKNL